MTPEFLERQYLSVRYWVRTCVIPAITMLLIALLAIRLIAEDKYDLTHSAVILAFFALFYLIVRAGHIYLIRATHFELKATYKARYPLALQYIPQNISGQKLAFSLARIKANLMRRDS